MSPDQIERRLASARTRDEALETAIGAAELAMQQMKLATKSQAKADQSARLERLLAYAERIKVSKDWRGEVRSISTSDANTADNDESSIAPKPRNAPRHLREPQSTRQISRTEQIILLKAGYLNGFKFPPWTTPPAPSEFELGPNGALFTDTPELSLSESQDDVLAGWMRAIDAFPPPSWFPDEHDDLLPVMTNSKNIDLVQDAATDCSLVASLCAGVSRMERGHPPLLPRSFFPYNHNTGTAELSNNGKYIVRLNFNGCFRKVVIDDRIPVSNSNRIIHVIDRHNPQLLWPALIEKAYLKVRGGYDFPGSNSGTDLWILAGWIPEQVFLQSDDVNCDRLWGRITNAFGYGDVLITAGTGCMSATTEKELGLAGEHDYAVLDLREVDGQRLLLIKNPWCEGTSWRGRFTGRQSNDAAASRQADREVVDDEATVLSSRDLLNADDQLSPGSFWMDLENVFQHFESIYLNWNPGLFAHRQDVHSSWDLSKQATARGRYASLSKHPQFTVTAQQGGIVWVLLCRHFRNAATAAADAEDQDESRPQIDLTGHISVAAFSSGGRRIATCERHIVKVDYVDSPQTLLKLEGCRPGEAYTLVPLEEGLAAAEHTFTLSVFGNSPLTLVEASKRAAYSSSLSSAWTKDTAGGNAHSPLYSTNPQFVVTLPVKTNISLLLEACNDSLNVHFKLVHSKGQRIHAVRNKDIVFDSGDYRRGCCFAEHKDIDAGSYTVICSTFEPNQLGSFTLLIESSQALQARPLPREGSGRVRVDLPPISFRTGDTTLAISILPRRLVKFYAIARHVPATRNAAHAATDRPMICMSIEVGDGPDRATLIASGGGEHTDSAAGVRTDDVDVMPDMLRQGGVYLVLDKAYSSGEQGEARIAVEVFADQVDALSFGQWRALEAQ